LTTRGALRALASAVLAAGLVAASTLAAGAASGPDPDGAVNGTTRPASAGVTPGTGPVSVAVIAPITLPPTTSGLVSADDLETLTGPFGALTRQLDALAGTPAAIALDPMIVASIRVLGSAAPASAQQWLTRLGALSNEVFLLAYADADLVPAARTGTLAQLQPSGFGFALDAANFSPAETPAPTPTPTPTTPVDPDAAPPFPTTDDLLAWPSTLPRIAWPSTDVGAADLAALVEAGYEDVIVSSTTTDDPSAPLISLDGIRGIVVDDGITESLRAAVGAASTTVRATALEALDAQLAAETASRPGRGLVLTLDRTWSSAQPGLSDALTRLASTTSASFVTLGDILATAPVAGELGDGTDTDERDAVFTALAQDAAAETSFSSVLDDPAPLLDPRRLERIALYALAWHADEPGWTDAVAAFRQRSTEIVTSVKLEQGSDMALLAAHANVKIAVSNALPYPVNVRVSIDPQGPILRVLESQLLTVEPESTATAVIPVEAVANGQVTVLTSIESPTGVPLDSGHASVTVHAEWEGIGTLVVVVVLVLIFLAGLLRLIVTRRRRSRAAAASDDDASDDATETASASASEKSDG
jgi:hypothetical protein